MSIGIGAGVLGLLLGVGGGSSQNAKLSEQIVTLQEQIIDAETAEMNVKTQLAAAQKRNSDESSRLTARLAEANERATAAEEQVAEHTRVAEEAVAAEAAAAAQAPRALAQTPPVNVYYANCAAARAAGAAPVRVGQPGYGTHLDRDRDGIGCE